MNENINYGRMYHYYSQMSRIKKIPFFGSFELTPRCNMNCKMCYIRMTEEEMHKVGYELTIENWLSIAKDAVNEGMMHLLLTGGETILYPNFKKLYLELKKMGIFISINSNGTLFNEEWGDFFANHLPAQINLTLYGGSNETYARLCGNPKGFDQIINSIKLLKERNIPMALNCVVTKQNFDDLEEIYRIGREFDIPINSTSYCFPPVRKEGIDNPDINRFTAKKAAIARIKLNWVDIADEDRFYKNISSVLNDYSSSELKENRCLDEVGEKVLCAAGRSNFWITWDGRMLPCGMIPNYSVDVLKNGFAESWKNIVAYTETIRLASDCANCEKNKICSPCAAKLMAETGSFSKKSDYLCEFTDEYINLLKYAKEKLNTK